MRRLVGERTGSIRIRILKAIALRGFAWLGNGWTAKDVDAANGPEKLRVDLTPWLQIESLGGNVDLRDFHEHC